MCRAQNLGSQDQGQGHNSRSKVCHIQISVSHNSKTNEGNFIKLHRKIKQNEKACCAQNLGSHHQGQGHNQRSKVCYLQIVCQP